MTLCPLAIVAGCKNCPVVSICLLKSVIGDAGKNKSNNKAQNDVNELEKKD